MGCAKIHLNLVVNNIGLAAQLKGKAELAKGGFGLFLQPCVLAVI